jgi:hypothetical protein
LNSPLNQENPKNKSLPDLENNAVLWMRSLSSRTLSRVISNHAVFGTRKGAAPARAQLKIRELTNIPHKLAGIQRTVSNPIKNQKE